MKSYASLAQHPLLGVERSDYFPGLRMLLHRRYAIYYVPAAEEVRIKRILHTARDVRRLIRRGAFDV